MLKQLYRLGFAWQADARRRRRRVDRRLRAEVAAARGAPSPGLRRRTIAALNDMREPVRVGPTRPTASAYAVACVALLALCVMAVRLGVPVSERPSRVVEPRTAATTLDKPGLSALLRSPIRGFKEDWEPSLRTEAKLIADDARQAGQYVLATLPLPASWNHRGEQEE